mgnify:CR=1 FL=1
MPEPETRSRVLDALSTRALDALDASYLGFRLLLGHGATDVFVTHVAARFNDDTADFAQCTWRAALLLMAPIYIGAPLGALARVQWLFGPAATTWLIVTIAASDSAQYYTGRALGRHKLAPTVSPAKTVEGACGGLVAAAISGFILGPIAMPFLSPARALAFAATHRGAADRIAERIVRLL